MTEQTLNQALRLTITELTTKLAEELTAKQVLAIQLTELQTVYEQVVQENQEILALLDSQTQPGVGGN